MGFWISSWLRRIANSAMYLNTKISPNPDGGWIGWISDNPKLRVFSLDQLSAARRIKAVALRELADRVEAGLLDQERNFTVYQSIVSREDEI